MPAYIQCLGLNYEAERLGVAGGYTQNVFSGRIVYVYVV